jgi:hypothetical protein
VTSVTSVRVGAARSAARPAPPGRADDVLVDDGDGRVGAEALDRADDVAVEQERRRRPRSRVTPGPAAGAGAARPPAGASRAPGSVALRATSRSTAPQTHVQRDEMELLHGRGARAGQAERVVAELGERVRARRR